MDDPLGYLPGYVLRRASIATMGRLHQHLGVHDLRATEASLILLIQPLFVLIPAAITLAGSAAGLIPQPGAKGENSAGASVNVLRAAHSVSTLVDASATLKAAATVDVHASADDTLVALSGAEYRLLRVFLDHPQRVLSREQLLNLTQGREADIFDRSIDLLVSRLRQRLGDDAREPSCIKTVRSEGYVFSLPVQLLESPS